MKRAYLLLRHNVRERIEAFTAGLQRHGYKVIDSPLNDRGGEGDVVISWNRIGTADDAIRRFTERGGRAIIAENATWGNDFAGGRWYTIANNHHNMAGCFPIGDSRRFDALRVLLHPFRREETVTLLLPQRGIGRPPVVMPPDWLMRARHVYPRALVRAHPGNVKTTDADFFRSLMGVGTVVTWGSGAAIRALIQGCKVISDMPNWIGAQDNTEAGRLEMFRNLAWAQWRLEEIAGGEPFARLLGL